ncbi:flagellar hook-length control protein FliK [Sphingomonas sp. MMS12-HWE2-04]|uniref:flagellar hook-length control protein FliK n=1 Tax=Sphingomonas sp. MMS12-HWE2-04 TaxID=3234199 RepID=UPI00384D3E40
MQVTTLGSPSPAGPGMLPFAFGGTGAEAGFAQALGAMLQGSNAASATPILDPTNPLAAQFADSGAALPVAATPLAPFQGTTNLAQLMATASTLPVAAEGTAVATPLAVQSGTELAQPALETEVAAQPGVAQPQPQTGKPAKPATDSGASPVLVDAAPADTAEPVAPKPETVVRAEPGKTETATPSTGPRKPMRSDKDETGEQPQADAVVQLPQTIVPVAAEPIRHAATPVKGDAEPQVAIGGKRGTATADAAQANAPTANDAKAVASIAEGKGNAANAGQGDDQSAQRDPQASFAAKVDALAQPAATQSTSHIAKAEAAPTIAAEPVIAARPNHVGQALGVEIARKVEAGEETLRLRLSPEHLGKVEITLAFDDGKLQATVRTESAHALDLLRQDAPDLARTLDQAGIRTDAQSFRFEARADTGGQSSPQQQPQRGNQPQHQAAADDLEPAPAYRAIRADGQVDLIA